MRFAVLVSVVRRSEYRNRFGRDPTNPFQPRSTARVLAHIKRLQRSVIFLKIRNEGWLDVTVEK